MNDPDYSPNDEDGFDIKRDVEDDDVINKIREIYRDENGVDINNGDLAKTLSNTQRLLLESVNNRDVDNVNVDVIDDRDWRLQLNDALNYVRERGRLDGRVLAEKISETFYELNGIEPTLDQLVDVFRRIKSELADEAQRDVEEEDNNDNGTAYYLAQKLGPDFNNADPSDLVDYAFRIVREDLVFRAKSSFKISKGREPRKFELKETVEKLALKLAKEALEFNVKSSVNIDNDDPDYNPNNDIDRKLEHEDELETEQFNEDYFNLRMLSTPTVKSKTGISETYDVYFCKFSEKREKRNLLAAIESFKMRNKREPTKLEIHRLKQFLSTKKDTSLIQFKLSVVSDSDDNDIDNDEEEKNEILVNNDENNKVSKKLNVTQTTPSKVLVTPVKSKKTAARYEVYFEDDKFDEKRNEKMAIKWFKRFNNREPTKLELVGIKEFIKADKSQLIECQFNIPIDDDNDNDVKQTEEDDVNNMKMKTDSVVQKKLSTKYTLNFDDEEERENGNEKQAIKWFKRFNNRNPTNDEIEKIKSFVKADNDDQDTVDID